MKFFKEINQDKRGSLSYFFIFVALSVILIFLFALWIPMNELFLSEVYNASDKILTDANASIQDISNPEIKANLMHLYGEQRQQIPDSIDVLSTFFQYSWIIIPLILVIVLFLASRQQVEAGRQIQ